MSGVCKQLMRTSGGCFVSAYCGDIADTRQLIALTGHVHSSTTSEKDSCKAA
jgi:hypothetical protein